MHEPQPLVELSLEPARGVAEQFVRYVVVGGIAFLVDLSIFVMFADYLGMHYQWAGVMGFMGGVAANYLLSILWVFNKRSSSNAVAEFVIFLVIGLIGLGINAAVLWMLIDAAAIYSPWLSLANHLVLAKVIAAGIVLVWNFAARKAILFS